MQTAHMAALAVSLQLQPAHAVSIVTQYVSCPPLQDRFTHYKTQGAQSRLPGNWISLASGLDAKYRKCRRLSKHCPCQKYHPCQHAQQTLRAPPNRRQATAFLMSAWPKMLGAIFSKMRSCRLGCAAYALNSASSSMLHTKMQIAEASQCHTQAKRPARHRQAMHNPLIEN